jgi:hypothetical protein
MHALNGDLAVFILAALILALKPLSALWAKGRMLWRCLLLRCLQMFYGFAPERIFDL